MSEEWGKATKLDFELESAPWAVESAGTHHEWELTHLRDENELHCPFFFFFCSERSPLFVRYRKRRAEQSYFA